MCINVHWQHVATIFDSYYLIDEVVFKDINISWQNGDFVAFSWSVVLLILKNNFHYFFSDIFINFQIPLIFKFLIKTVQFPDYSLQWFCTVLPDSSLKWRPWRYITFHGRLLCSMCSVPFLTFCCQSYDLPKI